MDCNVSSSWLVERHYPIKKQNNVTSFNMHMMYPSENLLAKSSRDRTVIARMRTKDTLFGSSLFMYKLTCICKKRNQKTECGKPQSKLACAPTV